MKSALPVCVLLFSTAMAWSQQPILTPPREPELDLVATTVEQRSPEVTLDLQCITLPQAAALPLIKKLRAATPGERAVAMTDLDALIEKGTAKLVAWPILTTRSGQKGTSEAVEEFLYPTEFTASSTSLYLTDNDGTLTKQPARIKGTESLPLGNAFNTRNLGITFEVEPTVTGASTVEVAFQAAHVLLKSIDKWTIEHEVTSEKKTEKVTQEQPRFTSYRAENVVSLESGDHKLAGIFKTSDPEPTLEIFILGAEIVARK